MGLAKYNLAVRQLYLTVVLAVGIFALTAFPARADDVTFLDSTDSVTASTTSSRITTVGTCGAIVGGAEQCVVTIAAPTNYLFNGINGSSGTDFADLRYTEQDFSSISDEITITSLVPNQVSVVFTSDTSEGAGLGPCVLSPLCIGVESGSVETAATLDWTNLIGGHITDTISFQSDVETPAPEPSSLVLFGSGLLAVAGYGKTKLASKR
jgi:PEP-CTERM motif